jgi:hypothetical protein
MCRCRWGGKASPGRALLETSELLFRGDFRLRLPFSEMTEVRAAEGELRIRSAQGPVVLELGDWAETWAGKIKSPRSRIEKLGVKPGFRVAVRFLADPTLRKEIEGRQAEIINARKDLDMMIVGVSTLADLKKLKAFRKALKPAGALWVVWPKGGAVREDDIRRLARPGGLVDVKVASFSPTESALKLVIPVSERPLTRRVRER